MEESVVAVQGLLIVANAQVDILAFNEGVVVVDDNHNHTLEL